MLTVSGALTIFCIFYRTFFHLKIVIMNKLSGNQRGFGIYPNKQKFWMNLLPPHAYIHCSNIEFPILASISLQLIHIHSSADENAKISEPNPSIMDNIRSTSWKQYCRIRYIFENKIQIKCSLNGILVEWIWQ